GVLDPGARPGRARAHRARLVRAKLQEPNHGRGGAAHLAVRANKGRPLRTHHEAAGARAHVHRPRQLRRADRPVQHARRRRHDIAVRGALPQILRPLMRVVRVAALALVTAVLPVTARAEVLAIPFIGVAFQGDTTLPSSISNTAPVSLSKSLVIGGAAMWLT